MGHYIEEIVFLTTKHLVINIVLNTFEYEQGGIVREYYVTFLNAPSFFPCYLYLHFGNSLCLFLICFENCQMALDWTKQYCMLSMD